MATLGTLTVDIVARTGGFIRGMDKAEATSKKWKRKVKRDLAEVSKQMKILASVGIASVIGGFGAVVRASGRQADAIAQLEQRIKSTGGAANRTSEQLQKMASSLQNVTRFGDEAIIEMQAVLLTFTKIEGEIFDRAVPAILDMSTALNKDLQSSAVQVGKALNDPIKGINALSRSGVQFTEKQKQLVQEFVDMNDIASAQAIILDELRVQFGGAAEAAGNTFSGALDQVKNAFGDLLENPSGLEANKQALVDLKNVLSDPETINAANALTGALIGSFEKVASAIRDTVGTIQFLSEELARIRFGAASDDLVRLNEELAKAEEALNSGFSLADGFFGKRIRFFGPGGIVEYWSDDELKAEIARIKAAIEREQENLLAATRPRSVPAPLPAPSPPTGSQAPARNPVPSGAAPAPTPGTPPQPRAPERVFGPEDAEFLSPQENFEMLELSPIKQIEQAIAAKRELYEKEQEQAAENQEELANIRKKGNDLELDLIRSASNDILTVVGTFADKQSGIYKAAFAIQKSAAIAESIVAIQAAIAKASNAPFPANLAAMAAVAAQTAGIVATISGTRIQGQAHDGLMSVPKTGTYMLEQGERVVPAETTAKMDNLIDKANNGGNIRIINAFDMGLVSDYLGSVDGEKAVLNVVKKNQRTIKNLAMS